MADHVLVWQRIPVSMSCLAFIVLASLRPTFQIRLVLFSVLVVLACPEKLASIANTVAVERDWVSLATPNPENVEGRNKMANLDDVWVRSLLLLIMMTPVDKVCPAYTLLKMKQIRLIPNS